MKNITVKFLKQFGACESGIKFFEMNKLERFPIELLDQVVGDYCGFVDWIKYKLKDQFYVDKNGNLIRIENSYGYWKNLEYDSNNNLIRTEDSSGCWKNMEYDSNNNLIRTENSSGCWKNMEYDSNNNLIKTETSSGYWEMYEYYDDGQLKSIGGNYNLFIPWFPKSLAIWYTNNKDKFNPQF